MGLLSQKYSPGPALCWFGIRAEGTELKRRMRKLPHLGVMMNKGWTCAHHRAKGGRCSTQGRATCRWIGQNAWSMMVCFVFQCIPWITVGYLLNEEVDGWRNEFRSLAWLEVCARDHQAWRDGDRPDCNGPKYPVKAPALSPGLPGKWQQQEVTSKWDSCFYLWVYLTAVDRSEFFYNPDFWEYSNHGQALVELTECRLTFWSLKCSPKEEPWWARDQSFHPPTLSLSSGQGAPQESSQVTTSTLPRV